MSLDEHHIYSTEQDRLTEKTVLRVKEVKNGSGEITSYAMTVSKFIEIAHKSNFLGFAHHFASKPPTLERRLMDAIAVHEELNRSVITATREI